MREPLVSIIVVSKNQARYLDRCLASVKRQSYRNIELIVVDNFSTDETIDIARRYTANIYQVGPERCAQFNYGFKQSKGEYVYRIDSDFVLESDVVEKCVEKMSEGFDALALHNKSVGDSIWARVRFLERESYRGDEMVVAVRFFKRGVFETVGMFDENLVAGEDYDLHNRIVEAGYTWTHVDAIENHIGEPETLSEVWRKFFYYGQTIQRYRRKNPEQANDQFILFRPGFRRILKEQKPSLSLRTSFATYITVKHLAGAAGMVFKHRLRKDKRGIPAPRKLPQTTGSASEGKKMPLVSVIIPFKELTENVNACLNSLERQSYPNVEIIAVHNGSDRELTEVLKAHKNIDVEICEDGKSASRNRGAIRARGDYLLHLDADMVVMPDLVLNCIELARGGAVAVIIPENYKSRVDSYMSKCFMLEKCLYKGDKAVESSRFFDKKLFDEIGGFDERLDPIDEADVQAKLDDFSIPRVTASDGITIVQDRSLLDDTKAKFLRGQAAPLFNYRHAGSEQVKPSRRARGALKHFRKAFSIDPVHAIGVVVIKGIETGAFLVGTVAMDRKHRQSLRDMKNLRIFDSESKTYESRFYKETPGARYVDTMEKAIVLEQLKSHNILETAEVRFLDIGMGGGRWSRFLLTTYENATVVGLDFSPEMVKNTREGMAGFGRRFKGVEAGMEDMPFGNNVFDAAVCFRSFKYVPNPENALKEICRVLKHDGLIILEAPNKSIIAAQFSSAAIIFGKVTDKGLAGYFSRITMVPAKKLLGMFREASLNVTGYHYLLAVPSTMLAKIKNPFLLKTLESIDKVASNRLFGRSVLITARSVKTGEDGDRQQ